MGRDIYDHLANQIDRMFVSGGDHRIAEKTIGRYHDTLIMVVLLLDATFT